MTDTINQWNSAAKIYSQSQEQSEFAESNKAVVRSRFSKMKGICVLDLGCGYGWYTDYFRSIGAAAVGVDGSSEMINLAKERYPECSFDICDITKKLPYGNASFDLIFCNQVLMDIENIEPIFLEVERILKSGGVFYYSIVHPAFYDCEWIKNESGYRYAKSIIAYIGEYKITNEFWGITTHFHRPLSYYLNLASDCGLIFKHIEEPKSYDGITKNDDLPLFVFAEYMKE